MASYSWTKYKCDACGHIERVRGKPLQHSRCTGGSCSGKSIWTEFHAGPEKYARAYGEKGSVVKNTQWPRSNPIEFATPKGRKATLMAVYKRFNRVGDGSIRNKKHYVYSAKEHSHFVLEDLSDSQLHALAVSSGALIPSTRENPSPAACVRCLKRHRQPGDLCKSCQAAAPAEKEIGYAYPSSPLATKSGHGATGCFRVTSPQGVKAFKDKENAIAYAESLPYPYNKYSMYRENPLVPWWG